MAFSGSTSRISRGIFSDYPRDLNLQAAEASWLFPTSWVAGIKFQSTFNQRISKRCVSLQERPWKRFEVISSKALGTRTWEQCAWFLQCLQICFPRRLDLLCKAIRFGPISVHIPFCFSLITPLFMPENFRKDYASMPHPFLNADSFKATLDSSKCNPGELYRKNRIAVKIAVNGLWLV